MVDRRAVRRIAIAGDARHSGTRDGGDARRRWLRLKREERRSLP
jgi:hypothetical protein